MRIRRALLTDLERIMTIIDEGRSALRASNVDQWQGGYPCRETIETDIARGESYVVVDKTGAVVATVAFGFAGKHAYDFIHDGEWLTSSSCDAPEYLTVHRLAVSSEGRGKGVATFILGQAQRVAREQGKSSVRIDTHPQNEPMRRSIERAGYSECGIVFASDASTRVAYEKPLD